MVCSIEISIKDFLFEDKLLCSNAWSVPLNHEYTKLNAKIEKNQTICEACNFIFINMSAVLWVYWFQSRTGFWMCTHNSTMSNYVVMYKNLCYYFLLRIFLVLMKMGGRIARIASHGLMNFHALTQGQTNHSRVPFLRSFLMSKGENQKRI